MRQITASCLELAGLVLVISTPPSHPTPPPPGSIEVPSLQKLQPVSCLHRPVIFGAPSGPPSAGSAVFEGPPAPLIRPGTPRRERAPSPAPPHCSVLFLQPCSPHSMELGGTSSISPVPHVNRRFNQTLLPGPPLLPPQPHLPPSRLTEMEKKAPPSAAGFKTHYPPLLFFSLSPVILFCGLMPPRFSRSVVMKGAGLHGVHEEHRTLILRGGRGRGIHLPCGGTSQGKQTWTCCSSLRPPRADGGGGGAHPDVLKRVCVCVNAHQRRAERDVSAPLQGS